uniref:Uncharacterized protein n=1 Tax=Hyaloperonospora arabidopsidis (strain Emoy2) TaxID=559515 RepID=M4B9Y3_HYAAE
MASELITIREMVGDSSRPVGTKRQDLYTQRVRRHYIGLCSCVVDHNCKE